VGTLSSGQRQTVALVMATMSKPALLLFDEHIANLDPRTAQVVLELTETISEEGKNNHFNGYPQYGAGTTLR